MSKNRRGFVRCEHCNGSGWVKAQSTKRRRGSARSKVQRFESSVATLAPSGWAPGSNGFNSRPNGFNSRPTEPELDPIDQSPLSPGESRSSTLYHQWSREDIWVTALIAGLSGVAIGVPGTIICVAFKTKAVWPLLTWTVPPVIMWAVKVKDFFTDDKAVIQSQQQERVQEAAPIIQAPPSADIVINAENKQTRAKLWAPKSDHTGLWRYAQALVSGEAAPSYEGGDHVKGANAFGYKPEEYDGRSDAWRPVAIKAGLLEDDPHKSKGYRLTKTGRRAMGAIANGQIGEWG